MEGVGFVKLGFLTGTLISVRIYRFFGVLACVRACAILRGFLA